MERPTESAYYVAQRLDEALKWYEMDDGSGYVSGLKEMMIERARAAVDLLRWYDWEDEQRRRQSLKGS